MYLNPKHPKLLVIDRNEKYVQDKLELRLNSSSSLRVAISPSIQLKLVKSKYYFKHRYSEDGSTKDNYP